MIEDLLEKYQIEGAEWLARRMRAYLADPPGLGKTRTLLFGAWLVGARRVLVIAPAVALAHWRREFEVLEPVTPRSEPALLMVVSHQQYATSATAREEVALFGPDLLILDEAQYEKHRASLRTYHILGSRGLLQRVPRAWASSGTPVPRNPNELWPVVSAFWPVEVLRDLRIASSYQWRERFTFWKPGTYGPRILGAKNVDQLRAFLRGKMLRRTEAKVLPDLPPIRWEVYALTVHGRERAEAFAVEGALTPEERDAVVTRPWGTSSVRKALGLIKAPIAVDLIRAEMLANPDEKRVVFAYHRDVLDILENGLAEFGVVRVDGSTSRADRDKAESAFQGDGFPRIFLGQTEAAGTSITLTAANQADIVEPDWRTDFNIQDGKRIHRIGQERSSLVRMLMMPDTLDEAIVAQHHREVRMVQKVLND